MKRRTVLSATGIGAATALGGCLETIGETGDAADEGTNGMDACETGKKVIEAVANEEYDRAAEYAPYDVFPDTDKSTIAGRYGDIPRFSVDGSLTCTKQRPDDEFVRTFHDEFDVDASDARVIEYSLDPGAETERDAPTVIVSAVEIDDEWDAWIRTTRDSQIQPAVEIEGDGSESVTVTLLEKGAAERVAVRGDGIDDPAQYRLSEVGETLTVAAANVGTGTFTVVASADGSGDDTRTEAVETISVVDPDVWQSEDEIVFSAKTIAWEVKTPEAVAGMENPTLVLEAGREYRIGWDTGDGARHNLEIRDDTDTTIDPYSTELTAEPDDGQFLTVTATEEMATYRCVPHPSMQGQIDIVEDR